jgi:hypothetical protein
MMATVERMPCSRVGLYLALMVVLVVFVVRLGVRAGKWFCDRFCLDDRAVTLNRQAAGHNTHRPNSREEEGSLAT